MKTIKFLAIIAIFLYLVFAFVDMSYGEENHVSRGKMLQSLSKYDGNRTYRDFIKSRKVGAVGFYSYITVLPQGASLGVTTVISGDRRYVRAGLTPFFSTIGEVSTFNFGRKNK